MRALTLAILFFFLCVTLATAFGIPIFGFGSMIAIAFAAAAIFTLIVRRRIIHMLDRSNERMEELRNVINGVAHELRTPLARLRNQLSLIAHDPQADAVRDRIEAAQVQADQLLTLFSALLRIAEIDSGARRANFRAVDLAQLLEECVEALEPVIEEYGHRVMLPSVERIIVDGDPQLLSQMVVNLLENAVRHTPAGTDIRISLSAAQTGMARLIVADNGPGIAPADRARALDRFGRLPGDGAAKGHGLGLPLAASIARMHGGGLELGDARPGLKVTVHLRMP